MNNLETDWRSVDEDPDPAADLGYETVELDMIPTHADGTRSVLVLPTDEEQLREDAFMVVDEDSVHDLETMV